MESLSINNNNEHKRYSMKKLSKTEVVVLEYEY